MRLEEKEYHLGRLLLLLREYSPPIANAGLHGLTKLAKLDFLLRYPTFAERVLASCGAVWEPSQVPSWAERHAVESRMIRYKYGPWDNRYYPLIGTLVGTELAMVRRQGKAFVFVLTDAGVSRANSLELDPEWRLIADRSRALKQHLDLSGNRLKELIYQVLPDAVDRPHRVEI